MADVRVTVEDSGRAHLSLAPSLGATTRDSVALDELDEAQRVPALNELVLEFDHYGRLVGIEVTGGADSILPSELLDQAERA